LINIRLLMAKFLGWIWMDPVMGIIGALVVTNWSYGLIRAACAVLLDMTPNGNILQRMRATLECGGDLVTDLHVWRVGPGHLGAIIRPARHIQLLEYIHSRVLESAPAPDHLIRDTGKVWRHDLRLRQFL
jgi:Co/Zn/Cd efflux system component